LLELSLLLEEIGIIFLQAFGTEAPGITAFPRERREMISPLPDTFVAPYLLAYRADGYSALVNAVLRAAAG
jgi:hypothetical protein